MAEGLTDKLMDWLGLGKKQTVGTMYVGNLVTGGGGSGGGVLGFLGKALGWYREPGSGPGIIASIIGALILLGIYRLVIGRRHSHAAV